MRDGVHQKLGIGLKDALNCQISARHPSSVTCGDSFPPGEALGAPAPVRQPDKLQIGVVEDLSENGITFWEYHLYFQAKVLEYSLDFW